MSTTHRVSVYAVHARGTKHLHRDRSRPRPGVMGASTLEGKPIVNAAGEDLGHVEKIMLDVQEGRIAYAVLSIAAGFGAPHKLMAVPWSALVLDTKRGCFALDDAKEWSEKGSGLDRDQCSDTEWHREVGHYYGA